MNARERISVLHLYKVFYPDVFGGVPYVIDQIFKVRGDLFENKLLVCSRKPSALGADGVERVKSYGDIFSMPISPFYVFRLWRMMRTADALVLHAPFPLVDIFLWACLAKTPPVIVFWHSDIIRQRFLGFLLRPIIRRTLRRAKKIFVSSKNVISDVDMITPFIEKVEEVTIPIDVQRFELNETQLKKVDELRILYPNMVLSIGRLVGYKGFDILIEAAKYVDATICIIGDGPERTRLQADIDRMGLKDRVHLIGSVSNEDVAAFLSAAALYALPSSSNAETFGISQLEALAAGLAVINTNLSTAVPHIARHEIEGLTVSPGNAEEFAQAIRTLLSNDSLRKQMEAAARVRAGDFSQDKFSERYRVALIDALKSGT